MSLDCQCTTQIEAFEVIIRFDLDVQTYLKGDLRSDIEVKRPMMTSS